MPSLPSICSDVRRAHLRRAACFRLTPSLCDQALFRETPLGFWIVKLIWSRTATPMFNAKARFS